VKLVGPVDGQALDRAIEVRESLYRAFTATLNGRTIRRADLARLNAAAAGDGADVRLDARGNVRRVGTVDQLLTALVRDALDIIGGEDRAELSECENPRCSRLFIDTSRAGTRRWCGMTERGNKAKVAAFRARRRSPLAAICEATER
jgi:predicted RNA-binding Zn ribbon-like protein